MLKTMKITCISAANIEPARQHSASTRACELLRDLIHENDPSVQVDILPLIDHEMIPCRMCGACMQTGLCAHDSAYNRVHAAIIDSDALFVVCPHYAPLPSKLMMLLEKMQELTYLRGCQDGNYRPSYFSHPVGLIAHGGQTDAALPYYRTTLLDPLAGSFKSVGMKVIGVDDEWPNGIAFGITNLTLPPDSIFVTIEHDWSAIRRKMIPLVKNVLADIK
jgi:hypothetical protein